MECEDATDWLVPIDCAVPTDWVLVIDCVWDPPKLSLMLTPWVTPELRDAEIPVEFEADDELVEPTVLALLWPEVTPSDEPVDVEPPSPIRGTPPLTPLPEVVPVLVCNESPWVLENEEPDEEPTVLELE